jgi:hypothetical protein
MKTPRQEPPKASDRNERLKAALKANIARRKAQARARDEAEGPPATPENENPETRD